MAFDENQDKLYLTELIDVPTLQMIQNAFSSMTGMAALTTDLTGKPITEGSNFTDFCMKHIRQSTLGCRYCEQCDRIGAEGTHKTGETTVYFCHAGLMDFAAPIKLGDEMVGCFIGGQVLTDKPDMEKFRGIAGKLDIEENVLLSAVQKVQIRSRESVEKGAHFLEEIASFLSEMAYGSYLARKANEDIRRAAAMKTDFLANMSHEIRTPMNAVIGMAEMALREDLDETAMSYIEQIKTSGTALLTIINDILDYSKIESGKLEIIPEEYEPLSLINDVTNDMYDKLAENVELTLDISATVPKRLSGDDMRIKQVIKNLLSNAVKFTKSGEIRIKVNAELISENDVMLEYSVMDTGMGIKEENLEQLFTSFQQLDSKRNRNTEGTGLGLTIANNLSRLMGGELEVKSVYGEGSTFSLVLPQKILERPAVKIKNADRIRAYGLFRNEYIADQFMRDGEHLGVTHIQVNDKYELFDSPMDDYTFLFVDSKVFDDDVKSFVESHPSVRAVELVDRGATDVDIDLPNAIYVRKPLCSLNEALIYNNEESSIEDVNFKSQGEFDYVIPDAHLLLVDDNAINITVAEGLIEPMHANIDRALSGQEAIDKIRQRGGYDVVLMDHMMPGMDGVETTRRIRAEFPQLADMPIIALTANAFSEVKEEFLACGMNDFIAKPIEVRVLKQKLKLYLPPEMIRKEEIVEDKKTAKKANRSLLIGDLDVSAAIGMLGNEKLFFKVLKDYYTVIEKKSEAIKQAYDSGDWPAYTIEVHALKSASRQIGANELADLAMALEKAGHENDLEKIRAYTGDMLEKYLSYKNLLASQFPEEDKADEDSKPPITAEVLWPLLDSMAEALDNLDMDTIEEGLEELGGYGFSPEGKELLVRLKEGADSFDMDSAAQAIEALRGIV